MLVGMDTRAHLTGVVVVQHVEPFGRFSVDTPRFAQQFGLAAQLARRNDFLGLDGQDSGENVIHDWQLRVYAQNSSSLARADPSAMLSNASAIPSSIEVAWLPA